MGETMGCGCLKPRCGTVPAVQFGCDNAGRDVEFISLNTFLPRVTLVAKSVPDEVAVEYLRQAAQTLASESLLLKRELHLDVQAGVRDYYLENGENEQVHFVHAVRYGKGKRTCESTSGGCFVPLKRCRETHFQFEPNDKILLNQTPNADGEAQLHVVYFAVPCQTACEVDKLLFDRHHDTVVNGALAELLLMAQYPFANPQMALLYGRKFQQGIAKAKIETMRAFETGTQSLALGSAI